MEDPFLNCHFLFAGDANTLSPMENRHVIKSNETSPTKADLMTMSTPPHLLSVALEEGLESRPQRRYYNHRSKYSKNCKMLVKVFSFIFFYILFPFFVFVDQASDLWYTFGDGDEEEGINRKNNKLCFFSFTNFASGPFLSKKSNFLI